MRIDWAAENTGYHIISVGNETAAIEREADIFPRPDGCRD